MSYLKQGLWLVFFLPTRIWAAQAYHAVDPVVSVIFWVSLIYFFGVLGRFMAVRCHQPGVLGELVMGVVLGNLCYFFGLPLIVILRESTAVFQIMGDLLTGATLSEAVKATIPNAYYAQQVMVALQSSQGMDFIKVAYIVDILSRYGVIFLLFMVGLESSLSELKHTGRESFWVAMIGILAPILLALLFMSFFMPSLPFNTHLFVAATLSTTSVGITARVLMDLKKLSTSEAKTILGAAVIDDVLGLILLAMVSNLVISHSMDLMKVGKILILTGLFFTSSVWFGPRIVHKAVRFFSFLEPWQSKLTIAFLFVMTLSWLAAEVQLATIVGAFVAGIIIRDGFFTKSFGVGKNALAIKELIAPLEALLAPLFFMLVGIQVKLESFLNWHVLGMASGLIVVAILGKLVSGYGGKRGDDRFLIGIGMLPRGEVGLVFASIGRTLGIMSDELFSAIIFMVMVTTLITPLWLKVRYKKYAT